MRLATPEKIQTLQRKLYRKAKREPSCMPSEWTWSESRMREIRSSTLPKLRV